LSNNCLVTSRLEETQNISDQVYDVLYIEDYLDNVNIADARKLTDAVFTHNKDFIAGYDYEGYKITWAWYSEIFQFCISYLEIFKLIQRVDLINQNTLTIGKIPNQYRKVIETYFFDKDIIQNKPKNSQLIFFRNMVLNLLMFCYSILSILFLLLGNKKKVGIYTGDFVYKKTKSDFRLSHLYNKFEENKIDYVEFIRETTTKNFFVNILKRRRFSIYYTSIIFFVNFFTKKTQYKKKPIDFFQSILFRYHNSNLVFLRSVNIIRIVLNFLRIDKFILFSFSSRSSHLAVSAKSLNIKTIGIMHGLSQKDYVVQEFIESYDESKKIGCDVFGVWSKYYLNYFKKYSKVMDSNAFQISGLLRPIGVNNENSKFKRISDRKIKVLVISEPLVSVKEIIPYLKFLLNHKDIEVAFKVRPMVVDKYYEDMLVALPEISNLKTFDCKLEEVALNYDIFLGSHSTAVIEASLFSNISILINTVKYGDYYDINSLIPNCKLLVNKPEELYQNILYRLNKEHSLNTCDVIRKKFFGDNTDASNWFLDLL
jgi:hypothetical protein